MSSVLIDTQILAWSLVDPGKLSETACAKLTEVTKVYVPPIAFYEIARKVRIGKWDEMKPHMDGLGGLVEKQGFHFAPYTARMATQAGLLEWDHRDPFDRMIAATALELKVELVSSDVVFDELDSRDDWRGRVWKHQPNVSVHLSQPAVEGLGSE